MKIKIFYLTVGFAFCFLGNALNLVAQSKGDLKDLQKSTSAHTTPRGVAIVAQLHIVHPETTHPSKYRGYYIYRKEFGNYKSEQEVVSAFRKLTGKEPSGNIEKDIKELYNRIPYKRLNDKPIAAPTDAKGLVDALGVELYQRLVEDAKAQGGDLMEKIKSGDDNLALYAGMFNPKIGEALGMIYYDKDVKKGITYYYVATKVREDFSEGDTTNMGGVTYGELDQPILQPILKALTLKERASTDTSHIAESRKREKAKTEAKPTEAKDLKQVVNLADTSTMKMPSIAKIQDSVYNKIVKIEVMPTQLGRLHYFLRGTDSLGTFMPVTHLPAYSYADSTGKIMPLVVEDTAVVNTMTYYYTIASEDVWGNRVHSDTMKIVIMPPLPPIPQELKAETSKDGAKLTWETLDYEYLAGFNLYKKINQESDTIIGEKINAQLIPANAKEYIIYKVIPGVKYQFHLVSVDRFGQESKYSTNSILIFENHRPPLPPLNLKAVANPNTKAITITWEAGTEADLAGYSLYRAQNTKDEPALITEDLLKVTSYIDTTRIGKNVEYYYYVRSMNYTGYQSPLSQYAISKVVEKIKPERVNSLSGEADLLQGHKLTWDMPLDANVSKVRLYRITQPNVSNRTLIYEEMVSDGKFSFRDKDVKAGVEYVYLLRGVNEDSLESDDSAPATLFVKPEPLQAPDRLSIAPQNDGSLLLKWVPNFQDGLAGFHIYRISYKGGKKRLTQTMIPKGTNTYLDKDIQKNEIYYYFVRSVDAGGFEGIDSEQVKFEIITPEK